ncbi:uncharacterized protein LOC123715350 [Pieris brassicae]|uniref:uncharacterized protein LOC123715350 n=1 Tax=Pieris brassicae TaxID=7116 RepID=UPI001E65E6C0|nr:uncharacterized protein LOC123715350 [Pieris brassicae]
MVAIKCSIYIICIISVSYVFGNETEVPKDVEAMKNDFSPALYTRFGTTPKEYDPFAVKKLISIPYNGTINGTRKGIFDWLFGWGFDDMWGYEPYANMNHKGQACLYMQVSYKNAIKQIKHYYNIRALYTENKEYEIGYLTHEIIFRYQIMLELYNFIEKRYYKNLTSNVAPVSLMLYFYGNILEDSHAIIHLCNMLHEVDRKFKYNSKIKKKYDSAFKDSFDDSKKGSPRTLSKDEIYERYLKMKRKEANKKMRLAKKKRKMYMKYGITTKAVPKYQTKKSRYPLHYGWSLEDWPPKPEPT